MADYTEYPEEMYSNIIKDIGEIPDYISNQELRKFINIGIHDAIMHSNLIQLKSSVIFNITIHNYNIEEGNRLLNCNVFFNASTPEIYRYNTQENEISEENKRINYPTLRRTNVEPINQGKIVNIDIVIEV